MKSANPTSSTTAKNGFLRLSEAAASPSKGRPLATSLVLKTATDSKRQHAAIGKLMKMCRSSGTVALASRGITAEIRKDRDRGHE